MDVFLERDIFPELVKWAERSNKGLFLRGPRQAGKTRTLLELGKSGIFPGYLYINLRDEEMKAWWDDSNGHLNWYEKFRSWHKRFSDYDICGGAPFSGEQKPLVILDEVQESPRVFNSIRDIVREQTVRLIATGSYLGIAEFENYFSEYKRGYFYPSGDVEVLEMNSMTYREVIRACGRVRPDLPKESIFEFYFQYGGYPEVVKTWLDSGNLMDCHSVLENIYAIKVRETQRYVWEPVSVSSWDMMFIGVGLQIEKKQDILQDYDSELTYKFRVPENNAAGRDNKISMMRWMLSCDLLLQGNVTNSLKDLSHIVKHNYYFADQGILSLALSHSGRYPYLSVDSGNVPGILAENFVALSLFEFMAPLSYVNKDDEIDFIFKSISGKKPDAVEVKFTEGDTKSSNKALDEGGIKRIIKVQRKPGLSTDMVTVYPMRDMDLFGMFLGYSQSHNRYTKTLIDVF